MPFLHGAQAIHAVAGVIPFDEAHARDTFIGNLIRAADKAAAAEVAEANAEPAGETAEQPEAEATES